MTDTLFKHTSGHYRLDFRTLETHKEKGLSCTWSYKKSNQTKSCLTWNFDWSSLTSTHRYIGLTGKITCWLIHWNNTQSSRPIYLEVDLNVEKTFVEHEIDLVAHENFEARFEYSLIPIVMNTEKYDEMFLPSAKNDAILEVQGLYLHVNKAFLSYHSDFFSALFSSNFREGSMDVIPLKDVTFEEIGLLFSTIYPKSVFPEDTTIESLLEVADRFLMLSAIHQAEHHLLNHSEIVNEKKIWMADKYGMETLLEKMIRELDSTEKAKKLEASEDYKELSFKTKSLILDKVMKFF